MVNYRELIRQMPFARLPQICIFNYKAKKFTCVSSSSTGINGWHFSNYISKASHCALNWIGSVSGEGPSIGLSLGNTAASLKSSIIVTWGWTGSLSWWHRRRARKRTSRQEHKSPERGKSAQLSTNRLHHVTRLPALCMTALATDHLTVVTDKWKDNFLEEQGLLFL